MRTSILLRLAVVAAGVLTVACSSDSTTSVPPHAPLTVSFLALPDTLAAGDIAVFGVRVQDSAGNVVVPQPAVTLTSSDAAVAVVDAAGRVRAVGAGRVTIRASTADGSGTASLVVTGGPAVLRLQHFGGQRVPVFLEADSVEFSDGVIELRYLYLEGGTLTLSGAPHPSYRTDLRYASYAVSVDSAGQVHLTLRSTHDATDQGSVSYDARGDLTLTSLLPNLTETASAELGGFELFYRFSASDPVSTEAFFAR